MTHDEKAREIVEQLWWNSNEVGAGAWEKAIATALRLARLEAIEECAKVADEVEEEGQWNQDWREGYGTACNDIARDIRSLKEKQP